ncbi:MAG: fumarate hydratase [Nitrospirota bacterium]
MLKLRDGIVELYKKVATSIPPDVVVALKNAHEAEDGLAKESLGIILENINTARQSERPVCQDTGIPVFHVRMPRGLSQNGMKATIIDATVIATEKVPLRPNAVDILTDRNSGNNTGAGFPVIYIEEVSEDRLRIDLMLKGAGCENAGQTYKLPIEELNAQRDLDGVRRCVLDAVFKAQGRACPPYTIGVGIGGAKDQVSILAKHQLFRRITEISEIPEIAALESRLLNEINSLSIGPMGLGGKTTAIGVKVGTNHRHPASYFVEISVSCWANRRGRLIW